MSYEYVKKQNITTLTALGGALCAALTLLPLLIPNLIVISYFAPLPLFLLGLGLGLRPLLIAGAFATFCIFVCQSPLLAAEFFLLSYLGPAFLVHRTLVNWRNSSGRTIWYPASWLLRDATLFAGIIMLLALGVYIHFTEGENLHIITQNIINLLGPQDHIKIADTFLLKIFPFLPGFFTFSWMVMMLFNASIAQGFLSRIKANLRPMSSFEALQIPKSFLIVWGLSLLLSFIGVGTLKLLGKNAALTLAFPFFLGGLGIVHFLLHKTAFAKTGLIVFYCLLVLFLWPAAFVIFLGMLKPWIEKAKITN